MTLSVSLDKPLGVKGTIAEVIDVCALCSQFVLNPGVQCSDPFLTIYAVRDAGLIGHHENIEPSIIEVPHSVYGSR